MSQIKRDDQRRGHQTAPAQKAEQFLSEKIGPDLPEFAGVEEETVGYNWYESLRTSGQAVFYTDSDWATAVFVAQAMNTFHMYGNGQILTALNRYMSDLMTTEGARRKVRLELERGVEQTENPVDNEFMHLMQQFKD